MDELAEKEERVRLLEGWPERLTPVSPHAIIFNKAWIYRYGGMSLTLPCLLFMTDCTSAPRPGGRSVLFRCERR